MRIRLFIVLAVAIGLAVTAIALDGVGGSTTSTLFDSTDVSESIRYDSTFAGAQWDTLDSFRLGTQNVNAQHSEVAVNSDGVVYLAAFGQDTGDGMLYTGLLRWDGSNFDHVAQDAWDQSASEGSQILSVVMSPVTSGQLVADQPLIARGTGPEDGEYFLELVVIDASTLPATETVIYRRPIGSGWIAMAIDGDGVIYAATDGDLRRFDFDGDAYVESTIATDFAENGGGLVLGPDGYLYAFPADPHWGWINPKVSHDILRVDPDTAETTVFASFDLAGAFFRGWAIDADGTFWIALSDWKTDFDYVVEVQVGDTLDRRTSRGRVAEAPRNTIQSLTADPDGGLYVLEWRHSAPDFLSRLDPAEGDGGDGGGGGGGGNGNGKGKNK